MSTEVRDAIDHALCPLGNVGCMSCGWESAGVCVHQAGLIDHDCPAVATKRPTTDEHRVCGTRTHPNKPAANGGDQ